jgi:hypothetical protein
MRTLASFLLLLLLAAPAIADERQALQEENFLLKTELQLARTGKLYLLVDLQSQAILIKGGGSTIWRLPLSRGRISGPAPSPKLRRLSAKKSMNEPKRPVVAIGGEDKDKNSDKPVDIGETVLELKDMPINYRLILDDGTSLVVEPEQVDWRGRMGLLWSGTSGFFRRVYNRLSPWVPEGEKTEVLLSLSASDARRLYWSFDLGTPCLLKSASEQP